MKTLSFDINRIEELISNGKHENAANNIFTIIEENASNKELIYENLNLLSLICDKTPSISLKIIKKIERFITDSDSWIRLVSLEILYQISMFRPNLLIDLITKIRARLFDNDPSVRRLTVKIIGNFILSLHINKEELQDLIEEFIERLMDNDWKVKLQVIKTIKKILNQDYTKIKDFEPLLSIVIVNLRDEDDDVARSAAELFKVLGTYFLSKEKFFYVLLSLLYNEKINRVRELIIWLLGEIGKERSSEIIPVIPKLIRLLNDPDFRIQLKVIDALVSIAENNFDQIWSNLIHSLDTSDSEFQNNIINTLYYLSQKNIIKIFPYLFEELENPSENIRRGVALVLKRLYEEYQLEIENEITKILYTLESKYWKEREKTILLLQNICFILKDHKLAVWISIELNEALKNEIDFDIKKEIQYTLDKIKTSFKDIDISINKLNVELEFLNSSIIEFQKLPAQFRRNLNSLLKEFKFNDTEIQLNTEYNKILKKINKFNNQLNNFEYKRLAFDLLEEWEATKVQVIEELGIIKGFIIEIFEDKKNKFRDSLQDEVKLLNERIDILKAQFDYIKEYKFNGQLEEALSDLLLDEDETLELKFAHITRIREILFKLDMDIREILIHNLEFNEEFQKELIKKWVYTKIEIQEYLSDIDIQIQILKDKIVDNYSLIDKTEIGLEHELAFQILQAHIQATITHGIDIFKKFNEDFDNFNSKLTLLLKKKEFDESKKLINAKTSQIQTFISETEVQIDNIIGRENVFHDNDRYNLFIRPFLKKWSASKELLINKQKYFNRKFDSKLYLSQIKFYLKLMNPIKLDLLSTYMGLDNEQLKEIALNFIRKQKLKAIIKNNSIYSQKIKTEIPFSQNLLLFFKNIKTVANKIYLNFKLNNPSNRDIKDLFISLKSPNYLKFLKNESFPKRLHLNNIDSGKSFKFNYLFKIDKVINKNLSDPS
ncbi:MAG: hypothetical protein ACTSQD_03930, partial [Promethearchaeota archaeon]